MAYRDVFLKAGHSGEKTVGSVVKKSGCHDEGNTKVTSDELGRNDADWLMQTMAE